MAYRHQWGWVHTQHFAGLGLFLDAVLQCIWAIILLKQWHTELSGFALSVISWKGTELGTILGNYSSLTYRIGNTKFNWYPWWIWLLQDFVLDGKKKSLVFPISLGAELERSSAWGCHPARGYWRKTCCCCKPAAVVLGWPCLGSAQCWQEGLRQECSSCSINAWGSYRHFCRRIYCPAPARLCCPLWVSWGKEKHWQAGQWKVATSSSFLARVWKQVQVWSCASPNAIVLSVHPLASCSLGTPLFSLFKSSISMWVLPCTEIRSLPFHQSLILAFGMGEDLFFFPA